VKLQVTGTRYEPTTVEQHLELAEEHLAAARRHIADQRDLEGAAPDPTEIRHLLAELETAQALHIRRRY
jgi:hypothetical protein